MPKYSGKDYDELSQGIKINRDLLDVELIDQPNSFFHASEGFAQAVSRRDAQAVKLQIELAELDKAVRERMIADEVRITEEKVKAEIRQDQAYWRSNEKFLVLEEDVNKWQALKESYRQRADMLKTLVQLHVSGYFGEVTGAPERRDAQDRFSRNRKLV